MTTARILALTATLLGSSAFAAGGDVAPQAPATLHWSVRDIPILNRVSPKWPAGETADGPVSCRAAIRVGGDGVPADVQVSECPAAFASATNEALRAWRWASAGAAAQYHIALRIHFDTPVQRVAAAEPPAPPAPPVAPAPEPEPEPTRGRAVRPGRAAIARHTPTL